MDESESPSQTESRPSQPTSLGDLISVQKEDVDQDPEGLDFKDAKGIELKNLNNLTEILSCIDKPEKVLVFYEVSEGNSLSQIAEDANVAKSTVYNYVERLKGAGLIEKRAMGETDYRVTRKGAEVFSMLVAMNSIVKAIDSDSTTVSSLPSNFIRLKRKIRDEI